MSDEDAAVTVEHPAHEAVAVTPTEGGIAATPEDPQQLQRRYDHDAARFPLDALIFALKDHPQLFRLLWHVAAVGTLVVLIILGLLLGLALVPQAEAFGGKQWWSWLLAVVAVLVETALLAEIVLPPLHRPIQRILFVETLKLQGQWKDEFSRGLSQRKCCDSPFQNCMQKLSLIRFLMTPLKIVPFVGDVFYAALFATWIGWDYMDLYFEAIQLSVYMQSQEVFQRSYHENDYTRFGFVCSYLEAVPLVGLTLFPLTNAIGAGLFASQMEQCGGPESRREG